MFELFLDREAMMYSSAYYETGDETLEQAQHIRLERICDALELGSADHLLEIGTGWGGMAVHAASSRGCRVTTTTISREQREYAEARVTAAGLEDLITVVGADYRDLRGTYDKLVSLEMIEAVGWEWFDTYFRHCSELLEPHGLFFLQAICVADRAYEIEKRTRSFANQVIFPGGCLPSVESIQRSIAQRDRPPHGRARGHLGELRAHAAGLARALRGRDRPARGARLRRPLPAHLVLLPRDSARAGSPRPGSATSRCCSRSRAGAGTRGPPDTTAAERGTGVSADS